jgi:hypothetical protein
MKIALVFFTFFQLLASDSQRLVGSFYTKKSGANFEKFFIFESKGKKLAFPVEFENKKIKKQSEKNPKGYYVVEASYKKTKLELDGQTQKTLVLKIQKIEELSLKNISPTRLEAKDVPRDRNELGMKNTDRGNGPSGLNITGINDKVANTAIALGALAILADILIKK